LSKYPTGKCIKPNWLITHSCSAGVKNVQLTLLELKLKHNTYLVVSDLQHFYMGTFLIIKAVNFFDRSINKPHLCPLQLSLILTILSVITSPPSLPLSFPAIADGSAEVHMKCKFTHGSRFIALLSDKCVCVCVSVCVFPLSR